MTIELDFMCDTCGRPVEDGDGALYVSLAAIRQNRAEQAEWEKTRPRHGAMDVATLMMMPRTIPWHIHHDRCAPTTEDVYDICVERVRTWRDLVRWTGHLMGKNWLASTSWASLIESAAYGNSGRIVEHVRNDAA